MKFNDLKFSCNLKHTEKKIVKKKGGEAIAKIKKNYNHQLCVFFLVTYGLISLRNTQMKRIVGSQIIRTLKIILVKKIIPNESL